MHLRGDPEKPRLVIFNLADDAQPPQSLPDDVPQGIESLAIPIGLAAELEQMSDEDRAEFEAELDVPLMPVGDVLGRIMNVSRQMLFFTAGDNLFNISLSFRLNFFSVLLGVLDNLISFFYSVAVLALILC